MHAKMKLLINGKPYSLEKLSRQLGIKVQDVSIALETPDASFQASVSGIDSLSPALSVDTKGKCIDRPLFRVETNDCDGFAAPVAYLYGIGESYIAYEEVDTRPDSEINDSDDPDNLVIGGNGPDQMLNVLLENGYVSVQK